MSMDGDQREQLGRIEGTQIILLSEFRDFRTKQFNVNDHVENRLKSLEETRSENKGRKAVWWILLGGGLTTLLSTIWGAIPKAFAQIFSIH